MMALVEQKSDIFLLMNGQSRMSQMNYQILLHMHTSTCMCGALCDLLAQACLYPDMATSCFHTFWDCLEAWFCGSNHMKMRFVALRKL